ncbi:MAG: hypothetical protein ACE15D_04730 [Candidatus Eisenbacteria bacterium]|nr:hypothetical protein [Candidatus Eisenbacteria bacterium]
MRAALWLCGTVLGVALAGPPVLGGQALAQAEEQAQSQEKQQEQQEKQQQEQQEQQQQREQQQDEQDRQGTGQESDEAHTREGAKTHGGQITEMQGYTFETVFDSDGVHVWIFGDKMTPVMQLDSVSGTAILQWPNGKSQTIELKEQIGPPGENTAERQTGTSGETRTEERTEAGAGQSGSADTTGAGVPPLQPQLFGQANLWQAEPGEIRAVITIRNLPGAKKEVTFAQQWKPPAGDEEGKEEGRNGQGGAKNGNGGASGTSGTNDNDH